MYNFKRIILTQPLAEPGFCGVRMFWEITYWMETFHLAFEIWPDSESKLGMVIWCMSENLIADASRNAKSSLVKKRRRCEF